MHVPEYNVNVVDDVDVDVDVVVVVVTVRVVVDGASVVVVM